MKNKLIRLQNELEVSKEKVKVLEALFEIIENRDYTKKCAAIAKENRLEAIKVWAKGLGLTCEPQTKDKTILYIGL